MARAPKKRASDHETGDLPDVTAKLRTAPCVPALRTVLRVWRAEKYKGATDTTRRLLKHWFETDHRLPDGEPFRDHPAQREAIETLVDVFEVEKVRTGGELLQRYVTELKGVAAPPHPWATHALKMATGSGKTRVMALAIAWQFLNAQREQADVANAYARTFLLLAPNVIVFERLRSDFAGGRIFDTRIVPTELKLFWDFDVVERGDGPA